MAEKIKITNSYYKELFISKTDQYGNEKPIDLSKYNDCYVVFKKDRNTLDEDAYLIKKISPDSAVTGVLPIYLTPEETKLLPLTSFESDIPYFYMFVQVGSSATGENMEVGAYKVKTEYAGLRYYTKVDTDLSDLGPITGFVGYTFDCGRLCQPAVYILDLSGGAPVVTDCGRLTNYEYMIIDLGNIEDEAVETYDLSKFTGVCDVNI